MGKIFYEDKMQNANSDIAQDWFWILNNCYKFSSQGLEVQLSKSNLFIIFH